MEIITVSQNNLEKEHIVVQFHVAMSIQAKKAANSLNAD